MPEARQSTPRKPNKRRIAMLLLAAVASAIVVALATLSYRRTVEDAIRDAQVEVAYLAKLYEAIAAGLFATHDQALAYLASEVLDNGIPNDLRAWAKKRELIRDAAFRLSIIDATGRLVSSSDNSAQIGGDLSGREHVRVHFMNLESRLYLSAPTIGMSTNRPTLFLSKAIRAEQGGVTAIVVASLDPQYLAQILGIIDPFPGAVATVIGLDGIVRARAVEGAGMTVDALGVSTETTKMFQAFKDLREGIFQAVSPIDGIERIFAFRTLPDPELIISIGLPIKAVLAPAAEQRNLLIALSAVICLLLCALAVVGETILSRGESRRVLHAVAVDRRHQTAALASALDNCLACFVRLDASGRIVDTNRRFSELFGFRSASEPIGRAIDSIVNRDFNDMASASLQSALASAVEFPLRIDTSTQISDGEIRDLIWSWASVENDDPVRYVGIAIDRSELRAKELELIQASKLASIGQLAASVNHELAQPLNIALLGLTNLRADIERKKSTEQLVERVSRISLGLWRVESILKRLHSLSPTQIESERFDVGEAVQSAISMVEETLRLDSIVIDTELDVSGIVTGSRLEFEQVVLNLIANAQEAVRSARVSKPAAFEARLPSAPDIRVCIRADGDTGSAIVVTIEDRGRGIDGGVLPRLFRPFVTSRAKSGGTGLGLAISRGSIERLGGTLIGFNTGAGARFEIRVPVKASVRIGETTADA